MLLLVLASTQCVEDYPTAVGFFEFENQSDENIYITPMFCSTTDSIIGNGFFMQGVMNFREISKNQIYKFGYGDIISNNYFQFKVYKHSTMNKYSRQELIDNEIYDKLYRLSLKELQSMNFKIIYTGND